MATQVYCDYDQTIDTAEPMTIWYTELLSGGGAFIYFGRLSAPGVGSGTVDLQPGSLLGVPAFTMFIADLRANYSAPCGFWAISGTENVVLWIALPTGTAPPDDWQWNNLSDGSPITDVVWTEGPEVDFKSCFTTGGFDFADNGLNDASEGVLISVTPTIGVSMDSSFGFVGNYEDPGFAAYWQTFVDTVFGAGATGEVGIIDGTPDTITLVIRDTYLVPDEVYTSVALGTPNDLTTPFTETDCL